MWGSILSQDFFAGLNLQHTFLGILGMLFYIWFGLRNGVWLSCVSSLKGSTLVLGLLGMLDFLFSTSFFLFENYL